MIKLFRKIRQRLLAENKLTRYLFYAAGEIILVVIGILIALQINNWNDDRKNGHEERELLENLLKEFQLNKNTLLEIKKQHQGIASVYPKLLTYTKPKPNNFNPNTIDSLLFTTIISPTFNYKDGALKSIISSGKLSLITNKEINNKIAQFPGIILDGTKTEEALRNILVNKYLPHIEKNVSMKKLFQKMSTVQQLSLTKTEFTSDYKSLLKSKEFENALMFNLGVMNVLLSELGNLENELDTIIELIKTELNHD